MTNELTQLIAIIRKSNNLPSDEKALSLAQVLNAVRDFGEFNADDGCSLAKEDEFLTFNFDNANYFYWDLTKDLEGQSPETLSQLLKLLKND